MEKALLVEQWIFCHRSMVVYLEPRLYILQKPWCHKDGKLRYLGLIYPSFSLLFYYYAILPFCAAGSAYSLHSLTLDNVWEPYKTRCVPVGYCQSRQTTVPVSSWFLTMECYELLMLFLHAMGLQDHPASVSLAQRASELNSRSLGEVSQDQALDSI